MSKPIDPKYNTLSDLELKIAQCQAKMNNAIASNDQFHAWVFSECLKILEEHWLREACKEE